MREVKEKRGGKRLVGGVKREKREERGKGGGMRQGEEGGGRREGEEGIGRREENKVIK